MPTPDEPTTELTPPQPGIDDFDFDFAEAVAPPRRRRLPLLTGALALCAAIGGGVVLGIAIQKHWGSGGSTGGGRSAALAAALAASSGSATSSGAGSAARGGAAGAGGFARSGTAGQVKAIDGTSIYVTDTDGNVVKVTTDPGVQVRVTKTGSLKSIVPGDFVVVQGTKTKAGYKATSISDSGSGGGFSLFGGRSGGSGATGLGTQAGNGAPTGFGG